MSHSGAFRGGAQDDAVSVVTDASLVARRSVATTAASQRSRHPFLNGVGAALAPEPHPQWAGWSFRAPDLNPSAAGSVVSSERVASVAAARMAMMAGANATGHAPPLPPPRPAPITYEAATQIALPPIGTEATAALEAQLLEVEEEAEIQRARLGRLESELRWYKEEFSNKAVVHEQLLATVAQLQQQLAQAQQQLHQQQQQQLSGGGDATLAAAGHPPVGPSVPAAAAGSTGSGNGVGPHAVGGAGGAGADAAAAGGVVGPPRDRHQRGGSEEPPSWWFAAAAQLRQSIIAELRGVE
jgi:hypothetical protein